MNNHVDNTEKIKKLEANLFEQEHRPFKLIWNFIIKRKLYESKDPRRIAITKAIIFRLFFSPTTIAITLSGFLGYATLYFLNKQNIILNKQNHLISQQTQLTEASRRASQMIILDGILSDISNQLDREDKISNSLTSRIISFSHMVKPYKYYDYVQDSISNLLSPERSQLLFSLLRSQLSETYISDTIFKETNFNYSDLNNLTLYSSNLKNAKLRYSSLDGTLLHNSIMTEIDLRDSNIKNAGLSNVNMSGADLRNTIFDDTFVSGIDLSFSDLRKTKFENMNLGEIKSLENAKVHIKEWFEYLKKSSNVIGVDKLNSLYEIKSVYYKQQDDYIYTVIKK